MIFFALFTHSVVAIYEINIFLSFQCLGLIERGNKIYRGLVSTFCFSQILSQLDIIIRLDVLLSMFIKVVQNSSEFSEGVATMFPFPMSSVPSPLSTTAEGSVIATPVSGAMSADLGELSSNLSCFIMELDLLVKQVIAPTF